MIGNIFVLICYVVCFKVLRVFNMGWYCMGFFDAFVSRVFFFNVAICVRFGFLFEYFFCMYRLLVCKYFFLLYFF